LLCNIACVVCLLSNHSDYFFITEVSLAQLIAVCSYTALHFDPCLKCPVDPAMLLQKHLKTPLPVVLHLHHYHTAKVFPQLFAMVSCSTSLQLFAAINTASCMLSFFLKTSMVESEPPSSSKHRNGGIRASFI